MDNPKTLVKILIGVAWLDGKIDPEERSYLRRIAREKAVESDPEIQPLLYELRAIKPDECYQSVQAYLGEFPTPEKCQALIEAMSELIYADGTVEIAEAKLLTQIQALESAPTLHNRAIAAIRKLYQHGLSKIEKL